VALVIGLISGTSVDGIDAALVDISGIATALEIHLLAAETYPYPDALRLEILDVCHGKSLSVEALMKLEEEISQQFAFSAQRIQRDGIIAHLIGSHGQTVFHQPPREDNLGHTVQLGRGSLIAKVTGINTVTNFRSADMAVGGHGAPLVPKVDAYLLGDETQCRCVQNIGGIGNVTYLPPRGDQDWEMGVFGWDTGPGNALIDLAVQRLSGGEKTYDAGGSWASQGVPNEVLVSQWLQDDYFHLPPPKSTGRELFGEAYLSRLWESSGKYNLSPADWLATLTDFTAASISESYKAFLPDMPDEVLLCGGGSHNLYLRQRLGLRLGESVRVMSTDDVGLSADFKEAIAFAVLAYWRYYCHFPGNLPRVTGANKPVLLGDIQEA
jgi:anhydro-N-acetylmuramic acid kinase